MVGGRETAFKLISILDKILNTPGVIPSLRSVLLLIGRQRIGVIINTLVSFASVYLLPPPGDKRREMAGTRSVGYPLVDMDLKVVDEDTGKKIPMERVVKEKLKGEMCIKCPHNIYGYWPDPGSGFDEEGYVHSGDVIEVDEAGRVYIVGRSKDMANVSGYKVYTEEIDTLLYNEYPGVHEVATIGVPDPERPGSERIKIFIAPLSEYRGKMKEEDVIEFLRKKVPPYAVPKSVEFMDELPKNVAEKIFKKQLREEEIEKMKREGLLK
jgi:acyl-CoA synthetase (AMP-forming)/AMP-acid ligase II